MIMIPASRIHMVGDVSGTLCGTTSGLAQQHTTTRPEDVDCKNCLRSLPKFGVLSVTFNRDTNKFERVFCKTATGERLEYITIKEASDSAGLLNNRTTVTGYRAKEIRS